MYWLEVSVVTDGEAAEAVAEALRPFAHNDGVVLEQQGDETTPAPDSLEPAVTVKIYVPEPEDTPALRQRIEEILYHLNRLYPVPPPSFRKLQEEDWANAWKTHYRPFRIGNRVWIRPSWQTAESDPDLRRDDVVLTLDPGMAFGTGLHPTTQMCMQQIEQLVHPGMAVLDVGTGSGILAILAAKLAAARVLGVDTDAVAVETAVANARHNGVAEQVTVQQGSLTSVAQRGWDLVVVNILAPVIASMLQEEELLAYVGEKGHLLLSGIIDQQAHDVETAVAAAGGNIIHTATVRDWVTFTVAPT